MTFHEYLAAFALGRIRTTELPDVALQGLLEGYDAPALAALAGVILRERSTSELEDLWHRALQQLGMAVPDRREAGGILRDYYVGRVSAGLMTPRRGAGEIIQLATDLTDVFPDRHYSGDGFGITRLVGLYYSHDDVPIGADAVHDEIDAELLAECRRMVADASTRE